MMVRTNRGSIARSRGFSLAEVLVAVTILAFIILAVFGLVTAGIKQAYGGKKMTEAVIIAQSALERADIRSPQTLLGGVDADSEKTITWSKIASGTADASVTPAALTGTSAAVVAKNAWRSLLVNADLPASSGHNATLTVTMTAVGSGTPTFGSTNALVRVVVELQWWDLGIRPRSVRLQTLNLRKEPT